MRPCCLQFYVFMSLSFSGTLELIAHRGFAAIAPENTRAAIDRARDAGADSLECDVRLTRDGVPVVFHDDRLDRTTDGTGWLCETTWARLQTLDAGRWFDPAFAGERVPALAEVLDWAAAFPTAVYLDIKAHPSWTRDRLEHLVQLVSDRGLGDRGYVCSFDVDLLATVAERSPRLSLGYHATTAAEFRDRLPHAAARGAVSLSQYRTLLETPQLVTEAGDRGVELVAWTVDDRQALNRLAAMGVRRIITNALLDRTSL